MKIYTIPLLLLALLIGACSPQAPIDPPPTGNGADMDLANTEWRFTGFTFEGEEIPAVPGSNPTLQFEEGNQAGGNTGCNHYGGEYEITGNQIRFGDIFQTLMACEDNRLMEQESWLLTALGNAQEFEIVGDRLNIFYQDGLGILHFVAAN
jgi:heat shock protein HslJ